MKTIIQNAIFNNNEILHIINTLAYGEELTAPYEDTNDKVLNTITYTGHEKDYETNLTYMLARYYSQGYGRFLSPDPGYDYDQLDPMSWNLYAYVRGNPVIGIDPLGLTVYVITYIEDDDSFKAAAETRKEEIEKSENFDPEKDKVVMVGAKTIKDAVNKINAAVASLNGAYGDVGALEVYSHSGPNDGPYFDEDTEVNNSRKYNLSLWKGLNLSWEADAEIRLYGCNTGNSNNDYGESFAQAMADTFGIPVWGQPTGASFSNIKGKVTPVRNLIMLYPKYLQAQDGLGATGIEGFERKWRIYSLGLPTGLLPMIIIYTWNFGNPQARVFPMKKFNPKGGNE